MGEANDTHFLELWNSFLEGELQEGQFAEIRALLASDERLLKIATDSYQVHRLLGVQMGSSDSQREEFSDATMQQLPPSPERFVQGVMQDLRPVSRPFIGKSLAWRWSTFSLATSLLFLVAASCIWWSTMPAESSIAEITGLSGSMIWTGDGGRVVANLKVGSRLDGGTLEGLAPDSWVELTFDDGSTITLSGNSQMTYSEIEQKRLHLREGSLTANVAKQPIGKPMLLFTRSAKLEVLGTQFDVEAGIGVHRLGCARRCGSVDAIT